MPSFKSRLVIFLMRHRHLLKFRLKKEAWDFNTSIPAFRADCERQSSLMAKLPDGLVVEPFTIDRMSAEWLLPDLAKKDKVILYMIGGGYVSGNCNDHRAIVAKFAKACGVATLMFNHRLAPEDPFPAALNDAVAAYQWLLAEGVTPSNIVISGESAGGGLCLATLLALRDQGIDLPAAGVALSPWTDLTLSGQSRKTNAQVCLSPEGMAEVCCKYYIGDNDPTHPWISPLFGDLHGLPPILINVGGDETLLDDSTRFAEKAKAAGVDITLRVEKGMFHCYPLLAPAFPEATTAMNEIVEFIRKHLA